MGYSNRYLVGGRAAAGGDPGGARLPAGPRDLPAGLYRVTGDGDACCPLTIDLARAASCVLGLTVAMCAIVGAASRCARCARPTRRRSSDGERRGRRSASSSVNHYFGSGALRKQILFDVSVEIRAGEIVIVTGPVGLGKDDAADADRRAALGAGRAACACSARSSAARAPRRSTGVRRQIGYIFQAHNLLDALTAAQNVQMALLLDRGPLARARRAQRAEEMLDGRRPRRARARTIPRSSPAARSSASRSRARSSAGRASSSPTSRPPRSTSSRAATWSTSCTTSRKQQGVTVLLVTHDNRILDIADRIVHLEDGRLRSFTDAVIANTQQHDGACSRSSNRKGELAAARRASCRRIAVRRAPRAGDRGGRAVPPGHRARPGRRLREHARAGARGLHAADRRAARRPSAPRSSWSTRSAASSGRRSRSEEGGRPVDIRMPLGERHRRPRGAHGRACASPTPTPTRSSTPRSTASTGYPHAQPPVRADRRPRRPRLRRRAAPQQARRRGLRRRRRATARASSRRSIGVVLESWLRMSRGRPGG